MSDPVWQELAPRWERDRALLFASTRAVSEWMVERLDPRPGETVLELAAGTGETGLLAAARLEPGGLLVSSDLEPGMVEAARRLAVAQRVGNAEFRVLDAAAIALPDASVDGVLCRFGYILKGDPPAPLREIRRVLRPGGRFTFAVWAERERNAWMTVPVDVMVERGHLGAGESDGARLSSRRTPGEIERLLGEAGLSSDELAELPVAYRFRDADELWVFVSELRGPVALTLARLDEHERDAVRAAIEARATPVAGGGWELGGVSVVGAATRVAEQP